ncbi:MAG TPA: hypothetical protein VF666_09465 [Pyrinomonadaceae bacterium]|jgi:hypothetical protein
MSEGRTEQETGFDAPEESTFDVSELDDEMSEGKRLTPRGAVPPIIVTDGE